jgi:CDP-diacylglycerol--glycerol-3-phosphate 3-phosphatidyltransferase
LEESLDLCASVFFASALTLILGAHGIMSVTAGHPLISTRVVRETGLPIVGKTPMHAVARSLEPLGRVLVGLGVTANAVTVSSLVIAAAAAVAFALGQFGVAAVLASLASLADGLDGLVARLSRTESAFGRVLDTMIDRYVDALFLGGIAIHVRANVLLLSTVLAAIVGSFAVSYASSVERELGVASSPSVMRRAHRLTYLIVASAIAPLLAGALHDARFGLVSVFLAVLAIAVGGNVSAVRRLLTAARAAPAVGANVEPEPDATEPGYDLASGSGR